MIKRKNRMLLNVTSQVSTNVSLCDVFFLLSFYATAIMAEHHKMGAVVAGLANCFKQEDKDC